VVLDLGHCLVSSSGRDHAPLALEALFIRLRRAFAGSARPVSA
jgi:hypothetical protein